MLFADFVKRAIGLCQEIRNFVNSDCKNKAVKHTFTKRLAINIEMLKKLERNCESEVRVDGCNVLLRTESGLLVKRLENLKIFLLKPKCEIY